MGVRQRSVLSRAPLTYAIEAESDGTPWTPAVDSVFEGAYLTSPLARPTAPDWVAGTLEVTSIGTVRGLVLVGPGSSHDLASGEWWEWARLTDPGSGVQVVEAVGKVIVS